MRTKKKKKDQRGRDGETEYKKKRRVVRKRKGAEIRTR